MEARKSDENARLIAKVLGITPETLLRGTINASFADVNPDDKYRKKVQLLESEK